jgi:hypothetical protein
MKVELITERDANPSRDRKGALATRVADNRSLTVAARIGASREEGN